MFNKKILTRTLGVVFTMILPASIAVSCSQSVNHNKNKRYVFENQDFNSISSIANYIKGKYVSSEEIKKSISQKPKWVLDGVQKVFSKLQDLEKYLQDHNIKKVTANIKLASDKDVETFDSSASYSNFFTNIPSNMVVPLPLGSNKDTGKAYVFKGADDKIFFTTNSNDISSTEENAKKSWIEMHSAYLFRGVYFKNIQDLKFYLSNKFFAQASDPNALNNLKTYDMSLPIYSGNNKENNFQHWLIPTTFSSKDKKFYSNGSNYNYLRNIIENHIKNNSIPKLEDSNTHETYSRKKLETAVLLEQNIHYWNVGSQTGKNTYIVDSKEGSRGNLIGDYMVSSETDLGAQNSSNSEGIMDINNWDSLGSDKDSIKSMLASQSNKVSNSLDILISSGFNNIKNDPNTKIKFTSPNSKVSFSDLLNYFLSNKKTKSQFSFLKNNDKPILNAQDFYSYLNDLSFSSNNPPYTNLGNDIKQLECKLLSGKKYNSFYLLPIIRSFLITRLLVDGVMQQDLEDINNVFINITNEISNIINNKVLSYLDINNQSIVEPKVMLNKIYGFENRSESLYVSPTTNIAKIFDDQGKQGEELKAKIYAHTSIFSALTKNMAEILQIIDSLINNGDSFHKLPNIEESFNKIIEKNWPGDSDYVAALKKQIKRTIKSILSDNFLWLNLVKKYNKNIFSNKELAKLIFDSIMDAGYKITKDNNNSSNKKMKQISRSVFLALNITKSSSSKMHDLLKPLLDDLTKIDNSSVIDNISNKISKLNVFKSTASKIKNTVSKIKKIVKFVSWVNYAFMAFDILMDIVNWFSAKYSQTFFIYNGTDTQKVKYLWDGGETMTQYGSTSETHGIRELEMINPIKVTVSHNSANSDSKKTGSASNYYFNGKFYNGVSEIMSYVFKYLRTIKDTNYLNKFINMVFDKNIRLVNDYNSHLWNDKWGTQKTNNLDQLSDLVNDILKSIFNKNNKQYSLNTNSQYLKQVWKTNKGITDSKASAIKSYIKTILNDIKPVTIFLYPKSKNGVLIKEEYHTPYPYFSFSANAFQKISEEDDQEKNRVIFDPNINDPSKIQASISDYEAINFYLKNNVLVKFSVPQKRASLESVLKANNYSSIHEYVLRQSVFKATNPFGLIKYFWSISAATNWLKNSNNFNAKINISEVFEKLYSYKGPENTKNKKFLTIKSILEWLISKGVIKEVKNV